MKGIALWLAAASAVAVATVVVGCKEVIPPCGASDCIPGERRLCAVDPPDGLTGPAGVCATERTDGQTCALDPCSDDALTEGLCEHGSRCIGSGATGVCDDGKGDVFDLCFNPTDCSEGLQCWPWGTIPALGGTYGPGPFACAVYTGDPDVRDFSSITGLSETIAAAALGVCTVLSSEGARCDPGCVDCEAGLVCNASGICTRPCATAADCSCVGGGTPTCVGGECSLCFPSLTHSWCLNAGLGTCCRAGEGHSCNVVPFAGVQTATMCCVPTGNNCDDPTDCCPGTRCDGGSCTPCVQTGEAVAPGQVCCDPMDAVDVDPLDPVPGVNFCVPPCSRVGEDCDPECGPGAAFDTRRIRVCTRWGTRCRSRDSDDARAAATLDPRVDPADVFGIGSEWPSSEGTDNCNGADEDCSGDVDEDYVPGSMCSPATVAGCAGTFLGDASCASGVEICTASPGVHYCKYGSGALPDEHTADDCDITPGGGAGDGCCEGGGDPGHNEACAISNDLCSPKYQCRRVDDTRGEWWGCFSRLCGTNTICYLPGDRNNNTSVGATECGDGVM